MDFNTAAARMIMCLYDDCTECPYEPLGERCEDKLHEDCLPVIRKAAMSVTETVDNLESLVTDMLIQIGVPANIQGFRYLREAIIFGVRDPKAMYGTTKVLYPQIALKFSAAAGRVERSIRHAIEVCFDRADVQDLSDTFGNTIRLDKGKCTNSEFIAIMVERIKHNL